jgi:hypothetical protein
VGLDVVTVIGFAANSSEITWKHYPRAFAGSQTAIRVPLSEALLDARCCIAGGVGTTRLQPDDPTPETDAQTNAEIAFPLAIWLEQETGLEPAKFSLDGCSCGNDA